MPSCCWTWRADKRCRFFLHVGIDQLATMRRSMASMILPTKFCWLSTRVLDGTQIRRPAVGDLEQHLCRRPSMYSAMSSSSAED